MNPYPSLFRHCPCLYNQNQEEPKECVHSLCGHWKRFTVFASTQSACAQKYFHCTNDNFIFMCTNIFEYVNYQGFFPGKGVVRIIRNSTVLQGIFAETDIANVVHTVSCTMLTVTVPFRVLCFEGNKLL